MIRSLSIMRILEFQQTRRAPRRYANGRQTLVRAIAVPSVATRYSLFSFRPTPIRRSNDRRAPKRAKAFCRLKAIKVADQLFRTTLVF